MSDMDDAVRDGLKQATNRRYLALARARAIRGPAQRTPGRAWGWLRRRLGRESRDTEAERILRNMGTGED